MFTLFLYPALLSVWQNAVVTESMARSTDKIIIVVKISGFEFLFIISLR